MHRTSAKFFLEDSDSLDQARLIDIFHEWIREKKIDGLPIDVADYRHVPEGPGVMLVGHEFDVALDSTDGRTGLCYTLKRNPDVQLEAALRRVLLGALRACRLLEEDARFGARFSSGEVVLTILDRLQAPNDDPSFKKLSGAAGEILAELYGSTPAVIARQKVDDRRPLTLVATAACSEPIRALLDRLEATEAAT
jgi:hypothetical protein